jgi:hypothetical protein
MTTSMLRLTAQIIFQRVAAASSRKVRPVPLSLWVKIPSGRSVPGVASYAGPFHRPFVGCHRTRRRRLLLIFAQSAKSPQNVRKRPSLINVCPQQNRRSAAVTVHNQPLPTTREKSELYYDI